MRTEPLIFRNFGTAKSNTNESDYWSQEEQKWKDSFNSGALEISQRKLQEWKEGRGFLEI